MLREYKAHLSGGGHAGRAPERMLGVIQGAREKQRACPGEWREHLRSGWLDRKFCRLSGVWGPAQIRKGLMHYSCCGLNVRPSNA